VQARCRCRRLPPRSPKQRRRHPGRREQHGEHEWTSLVGTGREASDGTRRHARARLALVLALRCVLEADVGDATEMIRTSTSAGTRRARVNFSLCARWLLMPLRDRGTLIVNLPALARLR